MSTSRRDRRDENHQRTGVAIGIAGALIAALLIYQVFLRSDDTAAPTAAAQPASGVTIDGRAAPDSTTTTVPLEPTLANGSFDELSLRDPFEPPIRNTPIGGTTPTTRATPTTTSSSTFPTSPTTSPLQNPAPTTDVALLDVYSDTNGVQTARIRVGGVEYTAVAGGTFATNYKLVSFASDKCVNLTYADSPFSLCQGEQVTK
ncbi:MAG: hypothetical protein ABIP21_12715 [Acidimicrobiia bacterium]